MRAAGSCLFVLCSCSRVSATATAADAGDAEPPSTTASPAPLFPSKGPFEGDVTIAWSGPGKPSVLLVQVKGTRLRVSTGEGNYTIIDGEAATTASISTTNETATLTRGTSAAALLVATMMPFENAALVVTGEMNVVANTPCAVYRFAEAERGGRGEACMVRGAPFSRAGGATRGDLFSLRTVMNDVTGKEKGRVEVTKIDERSLDEGLFIVPAGYKHIPAKDTGWQR